MFSPQLEAALQWASLRHAGQTRKASEVPYFTHLAHVALILARDGADDETLIAAVLHDVLEDTTSSAKERLEVEREIGATWGPRVQESVVALTEPQEDEAGGRLPWHARKTAYLRQLERADRRALRVSAADKLHNLETLLGSLDREGPAVWRRFRGGPADTRWFYGAVIEILVRRLDSSDNLLVRLQATFQRFVASLETHRIDG